MVRKKWKCGCGKKYKRRQGLYENIRLKHEGKRVPGTYKGKKGRSRLRKYVRWTPFKVRTISDKSIKERSK